MTFTVGGNAVTSAKEGDVVTVTVTPDTGWSVDEATGQWYAAVSSSRRVPAGTEIGILGGITLTPDNSLTNTWAFTMERAEAEITVSYKKLLTHADITIDDIDDVTYSGQAQTPAIVVKDGETTLVENTDYTVSYSNNVNACAADAAANAPTVTITAVSTSDKYAGTATKTFTIKKADITVTAPEAITGLVYSGEAQTLITAGSASFGTVLYSLDGEEYAAALPTAIDDGTYTVYYKVEGDANHNPFAAKTLDVTIATDKTELNAAIAEADSYYESISETDPDAAAKLKVVLDEAKDVQADEEATQKEIIAATKKLDDAVAADVAMKRITITIPAYGYVSLIDGNKRQMGTPISGVSLHSVKSVTSTEVELTEAINVVPAAMPFIVHNTNKEPVTVSLVVSSAEADNVTYDSEHFKGTLVDKTFSEADLQAADYYGLLDFVDFLWAMEAGTLEAGKCWIQQAPAAEEPVLRLVIVNEGDLTPTGISAATTAKADGNWYDLNGRRVAQPTKGLFILNGKKVVIK